MSCRSTHLSWLVLAVLCLAACGGPKVKIGSTDTKGMERIAILNQAPQEAVPGANGAKSVAVPSVDENGNWPMAGYTAGHTMPNAAFSYEPKVIWQTSIGRGTDDEKQLLAQPVVVGNTVFVMDSEGLVSAINADNGDVKWEFDTTPEDADDTAIAGGLAVGGGTLYATTGFGEVVALKADNGAVIWRKKLPTPLRAAPTVLGARVFVVSIDNQLSVLNASDGNLLWQHSGIAENTSLMGVASPAVSGESVFAAYSSGEVYNLRLENGRVAWSYALNSSTQLGALPAISDIRALPIISDGKLIAVSHGGRMAAINARSGDRVWEVELGGANTPAVTADAVYVVSDDHKLSALDLKRGAVQWQVDLPRYVDPDDHAEGEIIWTGPVLAGSNLWLVGSDGAIECYSAVDGSKVAATLSLDAPLSIPPVVAGGVMYVLAADGTLFALR